MTTKEKNVVISKRLMNSHNSTRSAIFASQ